DDELCGRICDQRRRSDRQLSVNNRKLLKGKGSVSHQQAVEKADREFSLYRDREMKQLESDFDRAIKQIAKKDL
ncbi:MAG: hypothetical protein RR505_13735, partial [Raoultibacter sp.]